MILRIARTIFLDKPFFPSFFLLGFFFATDRKPPRFETHFYFLGAKTGYLCFNGQGIVFLSYSQVERLKNF